MDWLPPLNSRHHKSTIKVRTYCFQDPEINNHPTFLIDFHVRVNFFDESDKNFCQPFTGFMVSKRRATGNVQTLNSWIQTNFVGDQDLIPFLFHYPCLWAEYGCDQSLRTDRLYSNDDLVGKISNYVCSTEDRGEKPRPVGVYIVKKVQVPTDEFRSWMDWFQDQKRANPSFESEYKKAIRRPRDRAQIYDEILSLVRRRTANSPSIKELDAVVIIETGGSEQCCICIEEFGEKVEAIKLPCDHIFHHGCIGRWLRENHICPLCRHEINAADDC